MKWVSLVALTFQTSWQVFVIKLNRTNGGSSLSTSVVFFAEVLKFVVSVALLALSEGSLSVALALLREQFVGNPLGSLRFAVPGLAYTIMNNLVFISLDKLSAAVQQVTYQLKVLTAAVLAVVMLRQRISRTQWFALVLLVVGVALVQWPRAQSQDITVDPSAGRLAISADAFVGLMAVVAAAFVGGFAGVYMELVLKKDGSLWLRNAQLAVFGALFALAAAYASDGAKLREGGLLQGYTWRTYLAVNTLATGGLLVAVVIKFADNILRQFSTALSIVITSSFSAFFLREFEPDMMFVLGAVIAIAATFLYNLGPPKWLTAKMA